MLFCNENWAFYEYKMIEKSPNQIIFKKDKNVRYILKETKNQGAKGLKRQRVFLTDIFLTIL